MAFQTLDERYSHDLILRCTLIHNTYDFGYCPIVFINPSIQETFGKTTAESLASGTPVIAFNSCATPELLGDNNECGFLVNDNFASAYLDSLKELEQMGLAAPEITYIMKTLQERGLPVNADALTAEEAADEIIRGLKLRV